jgi:sulfur-oxidizing protein SoxA
MPLPFGERKHLMRRKVLAAATIVAALATSLPANAQDSTIQAIERYREMLSADNPAELYELRGAELWRTRRGPQQASLEQCDLGLGAGVVKGAYVRTPRYFADAGKVMDIESRIAWCMVTLQGFALAELAKRPFGNETYKSDMEALVTYVVSQSAGLKVDVSTAQPQERRAYDLGRQIFALRSGSYDFACATCHGETGKRIRLQELPNLSDPGEAGRAYIGWPAYRVSQGEMRTMQWRINDCFRQQRFPEPKYLSDSVNALIMFLAVNANGTVYNGPAIKR